MQITWAKTYLDNFVSFSITERIFKKKLMDRLFLNCKIKNKWKFSWSHFVHWKHKWDKQKLYKFFIKKKKKTCISKPWFKPLKVEQALKPKLFGPILNSYNDSLLFGLGLKNLAQPCFFRSIIKKRVKEATTKSQNKKVMKPIKYELWMKNTNSCWIFIGN